MVVYVDGPRRGGARRRTDARRPDGLVDGEQGVQRGRVRVARERHLAEDVGQAAEEHGRAGVPALHLVHERRLVVLSQIPASNDSVKSFISSSH